MDDRDVIEDLLMARCDTARCATPTSGWQHDKSLNPQAEGETAVREVFPHKTAARPLTNLRPLPEEEGRRMRGLVSGRQPGISRVHVAQPVTQRSRQWPIACLLLAALFAGKALWGTPSVPPAPRQQAAVTRSHQPASQAIETIRVGQRVTTSAPGDSQAGTGTETQVDPSTWRFLRLRAEDRWSDGTLDVIAVETLQPPEWIAAHRATVGAKVPLPLDLQEMGLSESLRADVVANEPCPAIARGPGRVVLTTVNHLNPNVWELMLADEQGQQERLRPTGSHKFYSLDRQEFIPAEDLREGEHLQGVKGRLTLLHRERLPGAHRVYNMTVETEHVYHVSLMGALVHNTCPGAGNPKFPSTAEEMDDLLGFGGKRLPDVNPQTGQPLPGRGRVDWEISTPQGNMKITYEGHPYHPTAPDFHRLPHYHMNVPGTSFQHTTFVPGDPIPGF